MLKVAVNTTNPLLIEVIDCNDNNKVVQKFSLQAGIQAMMMASDGSLVRVLNDTGVVEFFPIFGDNLTIMEASLSPEKLHGEIEFTEPVTWVALTSSLQKLIL